MAALDDAETHAKPRYSPEEVLKQLNDLPEDKRTFSSTKLLQALICQLETIREIKALQNKTASGLTLADFNRIILIFLKNVYNLVSALPGSLMFDALEDSLGRSGILSPFIVGMAKEEDTVVLQLGLPSNEALCDTYEELIRVAAAAVVCFYHYTNYPTHPAYFPSDDATVLFTSLALRSCQDRAAAMTLEAQLAAAPEAAAARDGGGGVDAIISLGEIRWLMHYLRAQLSGLSGAVFLSLGDTEHHKLQLLAQQADFLGLIKAVPENPAGYGYYVRSCLQFQQLAAAGLFAAKGAVVASKHRSPFYGATLAAQRAIALALAGGGTSSTGGAGAVAGEVSAAAKAAAAKAAAAVAVGAAAGAAAAVALPPPAVEPPALVRAGELRALLTAAREGLEAERGLLPEVYVDLLVLEPVDQRLLDEQLVPMLAGVPDDGEVLALADQMYPTRPPAALPRGAVAVAKP